MVHACRKVLFKIRDQLKKELDRMESQQVIEKIVINSQTGSSPLVIVGKKNGKLRVCLDPRDLNKQIQREHSKLPAHEEIMAEFTNTKFFSKLDVSSGFLQLRLDDSSRNICTFITPLGRYRFLSLPFGMASAPEVYHQTVSSLFQGISGVNTSMDDITVWGNTKEEYDSHLKQVLEVTRKANLKLNWEKCQLGRT